MFFEIELTKELDRKEKALKKHVPDNQSFDELLATTIAKRDAAADDLTAQKAAGAVYRSLLRGIDNVQTHEHDENLGEESEAVDDEDNDDDDDDNDDDDEVDSDDDNGKGRKKRSAKGKRRSNNKKSRKSASTTSPKKSKVMYLSIVF